MFPFDDVFMFEQMMTSIDENMRCSSSKTWIGHIEMGLSSNVKLNFNYFYFDVARWV